MSWTCADAAKTTPAIRVIGQIRGATTSMCLFCNILVALIVPPCTAFAEEPSAFDTSHANESPDASPPAYSDNGSITVPPSTSIPGELTLDDKLLLAQRNELPLGSVENADLSSSPPPWRTQRSYLIPALEIVGFDTLLNLFDRTYFGCCDFDSDFSSIERNLRSSWVVDSDSFTVNQLGHPYQGSMYHGFARASGLSYWESLAYTFVGSAAWEIAGETTPPSRNDQISTGIGGSFLGEALFRMSNLWLERDPSPTWWRKIKAAAISPPVGFNRLAFGNRFDAVFPSNDPVYYSRLQIGAASATQNLPGTSTEIKRNEAVVDFALDYGLPGDPSYPYKRAFDYFTFQAAGSSAIGFESVMTRGLLLG